MASRAGRYRTNCSAGCLAMSQATRVVDPLTRVEFGEGQVAHFGDGGDCARQAQ
jgi:hypothetical protein